jgi:hypothetical protein
MKTTFVILSITSGMLLYSGANGQCGGLVLDTVGPIQSTPAAANPPRGTLLVYSAYSPNADFDSRDPYRPECTDYKIYTTDGKLLQRIHNVTDDILENPVPVNLSSGKYRVVARANGYGYVTIPVIINAKQKTILHLEGGAFWPDEPALNPAKAVRLPDGQIIGWKVATRP